MTITLNEIVFKYCINCGNENDKDAKQCEVCKKKDSLLEITESDKKEIISQMKAGAKKFKNLIEVF
jgi:predicted ATP-dependent serine protease